MCRTRSLPFLLVVLLVCGAARASELFAEGNKEGMYTYGPRRPGDDDDDDDVIID